MQDAVNTARSSGGVAPVHGCGTLDAAAQAYAGVLAAWGQLSHTGPDGSTLAGRVEVAGYRNWRKLGENLAAGHPDVAAVIDGWLASDGHRANLLDGAHNHIGLGRAQGGDGRQYWVQVFGRDGTC